MKRIGSLLKETRENQGLSLEEVSRRTKIHINKLTAIENNDFINLPAKVFAKGLIRSYARELKIDEKVVTELCAQEFDESSQTLPSIATTTAIEEDENEKRPVGRFPAPNSFFLFTGIVIIVVLTIFIYATVSKIQSYSKEETTPPAIDLPKPEKEEQNTQSSEKTETAPESTDQKETSQQMPAKDLADQIEPPPIKVTKKEEISQTTQKKAQPKTVTVYSDNKLVIEAIEAVRVEIVWSDGKAQVILMKEKEKKTFIFSNPLKVNINNGGAVNIIFNNKFLGVPGTLNTPITLKYP